MSWSKLYECCIECGRSSVPHAGKGLCTACRSKSRREYQTAYFRNRYRQDPEFRATIIRRAKEWQMAHCDRRIKAVSEWKNANPAKVKETQRKYRQNRRLCLIGDDGIQGFRIGRQYQMDGENVWDVKLRSGEILKAIPAAIIQFAHS